MDQYPHKNDSWEYSGAQDGIPNLLLNARATGRQLDANGENSDFQ
jgi:hypothetical protein